MRRPPERRASRSLLLSLALLFASLTACEPQEARTAITIAGGDPDHAPALIRNYGCHTCHTVPGVTGANGKVGPPLTRLARRVFLAGTLPNTPQNLITWIEAPQSIEPGTAMPNLGVSEADARHIA